MQGISQQQAQALQADLEATQQKLSNEDFQQQLVGDLLYSTILGYFAQGARMSAMEHLVPEQMFSTEEAPANGISAVKAIQLAAAEGQKIYTITQQNLSVALQQIQLSSEIKADIRNAVSAGMEVTAHQQPVNFFGNQSVGYILLDPNTGAGAYRIGGGENGSETDAGDYVNAGKAFFLAIFEKIDLGPLANFVKEIAFRIANFFGKFSDVSKILWECSLAEIIISLLIYIWFVALTSLLIILGLKFGILGFAIASAIGAIIMDSVNEAIIDTCRRRDL